MVGEDDNDRYVEKTPLICIEVLSPEDTWEAAARKADGLHPVTEAELTVPGTGIRVNVVEAFSLVRKA